MSAVVEWRNTNLMIDRTFSQVAAIHLYHIKKRCNLLNLVTHAKAVSKKYLDCVRGVFAGDMLQFIPDLIPVNMQTEQCKIMQRTACAFFHWRISVF